MDLKFTYGILGGGLKKLKETSFRKQIKSVQKKKKMMRKMLKRKFFSVIVKGVLEGEKGKLKLFFCYKKIGTVGKNYVCCLVQKGTQICIVVLLFALHIS